MMVAVAVAAAATYSFREYQAWVRRNTFSDPVANSWVRAGLAVPRGDRTFTPGKTVPVEITYDFRLGKPEPGVSCLVLGMVWLEELRTKLPVASYAFDAKLTGGGREACSGTITWDAAVPRPGKYFLCYRRFHQEEGGEWSRTGPSGGRLCEFVVEGEP